MQKIGNITNTADINGEWTNGNVAGGVSPTILDAAWLNTIQRELANVVQGGGLALDPTNDAQLLAALRSIVNGRLQKFTSSGTFTVPQGVYTIYLSGCAAGGGGGGGAGRASASYAASGGGGGGAGQCVVKYSIPVQPGDVISITIGSAGSSGAAGSGGAASAGGNGGNSSFGALLTLAGGKGGGAGQYSASIANGGIGGDGYPQGGNSVSCSATTYGIAGQGGSTQYGGGGAGGASAGASTSAGKSGYGYGCGGGGGGANNIDTPTSSGKPGGEGMPGIIIVEW